MKFLSCPVCAHDRLMHDSWGCKVKNCCGVSIIYLKPTGRSAALEALQMAKMLDAEADAAGEYQARLIARRMGTEPNPANLE